MIKKISHIILDFLLLCILINLIKVALKENISFLVEHKESISHELDREFIQQLYATKIQLHTLENNTEYDTDYLNNINTLKDTITMIANQYKKNSLGLTLLGPIGTASIIIKEEQLKTKLLKAINDLGNILHSMKYPLDTFQPAATINHGLHNNKKILQSITI